MKITAGRDVLLNLITHAESVVEKRNTLPILSNFLLRASAGKLEVVATDLDLMVKNTTTDINVEREGATTIPAATFLAMLRKLPADKPVAVELIGGQIAIRAGRTSVKLPVLPVDDFPVFERPSEEPVSIPVADLMKALRMVRNSISQEETRYYLNGVCLAIEENELVAVSTDGHRLSIARIGEIVIDQPNAIVPRKAVAQLVKILPDFEGAVSMRINASKVELQLGGLVITSKLIDGTFPDYKRVIPANTSIEIKVCPRALSSAIDRVAVVSSEKTKAIVLDIRTDAISVSMNSPDAGTAEEEVPAWASGPVKVGYNSRYLIDLLDNYADSENVQIRLNDNASPAIVCPPGERTNRSIIMPMRH